MMDSYVYTSIIYTYMVGMWLCHIPTLHHYDMFPPGENMTGGNKLVGHDDDDDDCDDDDDDDGDDDDDLRVVAARSRAEPL